MGKANSQTNPKSTNNKFWQFRNLADDDQKAELLLYGDISERSWWEDAATPKRFADDLAALGDVKEITVYINSGGGDVFAAQAIGNMLERNAATVTAHIDGLCASAATIVACHADKVVAAADGSYMVHPVSMGVCDYLTAEDMPCGCTARSAAPSTAAAPWLLLRQSITTACTTTPPTPARPMSACPFLPPAWKMAPKS